jgi:tRNA threonylcarbamoyladenosine biosynthesis protein TsaB
MRVLALDTTTRAGSVALVVDDRIVVEERGDASRTHAERQPNEALAALAPHGLTLGDVDLFAVSSGPGSFTGLRIGIATIQGLALVHRRPVVAVSALDALAHIAAREARPGDYVAALMDAHRSDVFSALYVVGDAATLDDGKIVEIEGPSVGDPETTLERWSSRASPAIFIGDGAGKYAAMIHDRAGATARVIPPPLLAGTIGLLAVRRSRTGRTISPAAIQPLYVRRPDAEVDREKRAVAGRNGAPGA